MTENDVIALALAIWGTVQLTRLGLNYRTARRRDQAKAATP